MTIGNKTDHNKLQITTKLLNSSSDKIVHDINPPTTRFNIDNELPQIIINRIWIRAASRI